MQPGDIVIYQLSEDDAKMVNDRRVDGAGHGYGWPAGAQAHAGNTVRAGEEYPMVVVRVWGQTGVNGQVLLDGSDTLWVTSVGPGDGPGQYRLRS